MRTLTTITECSSGRVDQVLRVPGRAEFTQSQLSSEWNISRATTTPRPPVLSYLLQFYKKFLSFSDCSDCVKKKKEKTSKPRFFLYRCQNIFAVCCCFDFQLRLLKFPPYDYRRGSTSKKPNSVERPGKKKLFLFYNILDDNVFHEWIEKTSK